MKRVENRFAIAVYNMDTESSIEGYISAFMANKFESRLKVKLPAPKNKNHPSRKYNEAVYKLGMLIDTLPDRVRLTQQSKIGDFFRLLNAKCDEAVQYFEMMDSSLKDVSCYIIIHYANLAWDLDVIRGFVFDASREYRTVGSSSDLVQFTFGNLRFRDFLRVSGFKSIRVAGLCCINAHKADGTEVYNITKNDIPLSYEDYSETQKFYMENDVLVMDEALNIILNRKENYMIKTLNDFPMTSTSFGRFRLKNNPEIIMEDGRKTYVPSLLTSTRWKWARPFLAYLIRGYKGGYCAPNPHQQYKLINNVIVFDACSMYPDKMLFHRMMQCTKYTEMNYCYKTLEECLNFPYDKNCISALNKIKNIESYIASLDLDGVPTVKIDSENGLYAWNGTVKVNIFNVKSNGKINMMPFLSKFKVENVRKRTSPPNGDYAKGLVECNGKVLKGDNLRIIVSSVDLMLLMLCYDCEIIQIEKWLNMSWKPMLNVQKRDLWEAYKRKMHISNVFNSNRFGNDEYWKNEAGFDPKAINNMDDETYKVFAKVYKQIIKADPNGKYGMTVEKPIHPKCEVLLDDIGQPYIKAESTKDAMNRLLANPDEAPETVKTSDYCAGCSITMWSRWQLIQMMYVFYRHGIETLYCDTDSLFVVKSDDVFECIRKFNTWKKANYYSTDIGNGVTVTVDDAEGIGQFELDKKDCKLFKMLGSKNYGYLDAENKSHLTIAGLNTTKYQKSIDKIISESKYPKVDFDNLYRPNVIVSPSLSGKLLKNITHMGFDENGLWRGPILEPIGFYSINMDSAYHNNNAERVAEMQGEKVSKWVGKYSSSITLTDSGFKSGIDVDFKYDYFEPLEEQQPIKGGLV